MTSTRLLLGAASLLLPAAAAANTVMIQKADPNDTARTRIRNGVEVLQPTDEEHTPEQASFAFDPLQKNVGIVVMMSTGRLDGADGPSTGDDIEVGNIQGACMPLRIVQDATADTGVTLQPVVAEFKYVSQRNSDENRAYHHPEVEALGNGLFAITQNWDRNDNTNTERYIQVVDSNCNLQQLTGNVTLRENNTSAVIMAKTNDNCSGRQSGGGASTYVYPDGTVGIMSAELCNGNGADDGWANYITVSCENGTCDVQKQFDVSFIDQEERSRGRCEQLDMVGGDGLPDTSVCCGTEGNSQPQREGVWCAGVDHTTGDLLWKERVAYRGETDEGARTYAMRIKMLAVRDITGKPTGQVAIEYQMHRGNNNDNLKGGYDDKVMIALATPTRTGLNAAEHQDITNAVITGQVEMTHSAMFQTFLGTPDAPQPVFSFLAPNHNGGGGVNASVLNLALNPDGTFSSAGVTKLNGPADGQKYSKYLGNNPNDQGRNYLDCHIVANPYADEPGSLSANVPVLNMCALTGKLTSAGIPSLKPDLFFEIWTTVKPAPVDEPGEGDGGNEPTGDDDGDGDGDDTGNGGNDDGNGSGGGAKPTGPTTSGGCQAAGAGGSAFLVLLGFALVNLRRRRSR